MPAHIYVPMANVVQVGVVKYICDSLRLGPHAPVFYGGAEPSCEHNHPDVSWVNGL